jgi:putative heme degradation protein
MNPERKLKRNKKRAAVKAAKPVKITPNDTEYAKKREELQKELAELTAKYKIGIYYSNLVTRTVPHTPARTVLVDLDQLVEKLEALERLMALSNNEASKPINNDPSWDSESFDGR